ncbi:MAG: ABC transporter ATP-binding protein [Bacillota bacterium]|jgi:ATP-binding cassette subfamily B protein|nr:ABC transporter ATP-binding protein [Bacillota bacterium]HHU29110.1 ABC transporter ATP-binding protein [Bacillota bacterium]
MKYLLRLVQSARPYWWLLVITGISLLAITALNLTAPQLVMRLTTILTHAPHAGSIVQIRNIALLLVLIYVARALFRFFHSYLSHVAAWHLVADMRVRVYDHLQKLSMKYYHDKQTGELLSRATNDTSTFEVLIAHAVPDLVANILVLLGVTAILFYIHPLLALLTIIPVPVLTYSGFLFSRKVLPYFRKAQKSLAELNAVLQDNISGMKEIQVFNQQKKEKSRVATRAADYTLAILRGLKLGAIFHPSVEMLTSFGTVIVVGFGGYLAINGILQVSDIVGFILYLNLFYQPISTLARVSEDLQQAVAGAERVYSILDTDPDIKDSPGAREIKRAEGKITFDRVYFHYVENIPVLTDVSFTAQAGQMVALVGPTGVGKTTIISLIARFYDPVSGNIYLDGHNLKDITLSSLRNQISIVLQDVFLFHGTVAENIAYGVKNAGQEEIARAAKIARAHDFICKLPEGYQTVIGERGVKLSGGQKQRLAIARAVLRNTPILILDEATASVDVETEAKIQQAIQELTGSRTIIVIAHRLSTIKRADQILVLEDGRIVERGTHDELIKQKGLYHELCKIQFGTDSQ